MKIIHCWCDECPCICPEPEPLGLGPDLPPPCKSTFRQFVPCVLLDGHTGAHHAALKDGGYVWNSGELGVSP